MVTSRSFRCICWVLLSLTLPPCLLSCSGERGQNDSKGGDTGGADTVRLDKAIAEQTEAIRLNPKDASAYYKRGLSYDEKGEADKAIADFTEAVRLNDPRAYANRAACYKKRREYDEAIADYTEVIKSCQKSTKDLGEAVALASTAAHAHYDRGVCYDEKGDHVRAMDDYREAVRLEPSLKGDEDLKRRMGK